MNLNPVTGVRTECADVPRVGKQPYPIPGQFFVVTPSWWLLGTRIMGRVYMVYIEGGRVKYPRIVHHLFGLKCRVRMGSTVLTPPNHRHGDEPHKV
jgi:hypothetical protein